MDFFNRDQSDLKSRGQLEYTTKGHHNTSTTSNDYDKDTSIVIMQQRNKSFCWLQILHNSKSPQVFQVYKSGLLQKR
jgi:hypothetical protein